MMDERDDAILDDSDTGPDVSGARSEDDAAAEAERSGPAVPRGYPGAPIIDIVMSRGVSGDQAGGSARVAACRIAPPLLSLLVPGLGQAWNREHQKAVVFLAAGALLWVVKLGWIVHLAAMADACRSAGRLPEEQETAAGVGDDRRGSIRTRVPCWSRPGGG